MDSSAHHGVKGVAVIELLVQRCQGQCVHEVSKNDNQLQAGGFRPGQTRSSKGCPSSASKAKSLNLERCKIQHMPIEISVSRNHSVRTLAGILPVLPIRNRLRLQVATGTRSLDGLVKDNAGDHIRERNVVAGNSPTLSVVLHFAKHGGKADIKQAGPAIPPTVASKGVAAFFGLDRSPPGVAAS